MNDENIIGFLSERDDMMHRIAESFDLKNWKPSNLFMRYFEDSLFEVLEDYVKFYEYKKTHPERTDLRTIFGIELRDEGLVLNEIGVMSAIHQALDLFQQWFDAYDLNIQPNLQDRLAYESEGVFASYLDFGGSRECFLDYPKEKWTDSDPDALLHLKQVCTGIISDKGQEIHETKLDIILGKLYKPSLERIKKKCIVEELIK